MSARPKPNSLWIDLFLGMAVTLAILCMIGGLAALAYGRHYAERIYAGVTIQGVPVGGLTPQEALARLEQALVVEELPYVSLRAPEGEWVYSTADLGGYLDFESAVEEAWALGRSGIFRQDMLTRLRLLLFGYNIVPTFYLEPGLSLRPLRQIARQVGRPAQQARIRVAGLEVQAISAQMGRDLDIPATQVAIEREVRAALGNSSWNTEPLWLRLWYNRPPRVAHFPVETIPIDLVLREISPSLNAVSDAHQRIETILSAPILLVYERPPLGEGSLPSRQTWLIDQAMLSTWLVMPTLSSDPPTAETIALDHAAITRFVEEIARTINQPAREGRFAYDPTTNTLTVLAPEQYGLEVDIQAAVQAIEEACLRPQAREVVLPVRVIPPAVSYAQLQALLPLDLISTGETSFAGSSASRLHNIEVATARFHGIVVAPHARFSMIKHLGLVTQANGYTESWVIYGNQTLLGPGGGVCQVATTLFRAAFWGGYPILERSPHAYRVSWYEPPIGLDAAVFVPSVDVKFENDTETPILIQTKVDRAAAKLYFYFYGRTSGRTVRIEGPILGPSIPPGPPIIEIDPSLAPGQRIEVERARDGVEVTLYRIIEVNGQQVARERFVSNYKPWPAHYREGPPATPEASTSSGQEG